jgi:hypothetical protein
VLKGLLLCTEMVFRGAGQLPLSVLVVWQKCVRGSSNTVLHAALVLCCQADLLKEDLYMSLFFLQVHRSPQSTPSPSEVGRRQCACNSSTWVPYCFAAALCAFLMRLLHK